MNNEKIKIEQINLPFNINFINHTADIHIRNFTRHDEYKQVFDKFIDNIKSENAITIIVGDVVHSKIDVSNELYKLIIDFFTKIIEKTPLFFITGNHDLNEKNKSRLDTLTVPYYALKTNPLYENKIFYLKDSGIYQINSDIDMIVYSIYDNIQYYKELKDFYFNKFQNKNKISICLYHGAINGSKLDNNQTIENEMDKNIFGDYDYVLLGDIHKRQSLNI